MYCLTIKSSGWLTAPTDLGRYVKMKGENMMTDRTDLPNPTEQKGKCPLCHTPATFEPLDAGRKRRYSCSNCISFLISPADEDDISNLNEKERIKISDKTRKCDPEKILLISIQRTTQPHEVKLVHQLRSNWW
jgi:hypothetical protein